MQESDKFRLIESVRNYPAIYRLSCTEFKDNSLKKTCWEKVRNEVGFSENVCKSAWNILRNNYMRAKRAVKNLPNGSVTTRKKPWIFLEPLSFIDDCPSTETTSNFEDELCHAEESTPVPLCRTLDPLCPTPVSLYSSSSKDQDFSRVSQNSTLTALSIDVESGSQPGPRKRAKLTPTSAVDRLVSSSEGNAKKLTTTACPLSSSVASAVAGLHALSDSEVFGQHIARQLERLDVPTRAMAMLKMSEIVFLATIDQLPVQKP